MHYVTTTGTRHNKKKLDQSVDPKLAYFAVDYNSISSQAPHSRYDTYLFLFVSSVTFICSLTTTTSSLIELQTSAETVLRVLGIICMLLSFMTCCSLRYIQVRKYMTKARYLEVTNVGILEFKSIISSIAVLLFILYTITAGIVWFTANGELAVADQSEILSPNLYFSAWAGFILSSYAVADAFVSRSDSMLQLSRRNYKAQLRIIISRTWILIFIMSVMIVASASSTLSGPHCSAITSAIFCQQLSIGILFGIMGIFASGLTLILKGLHTSYASRHSGKGGAFDLPCFALSFVICLVFAMNAVYMTSRKVGAGVPCNVYFASWIVFGLSVYLILQHLHLRSIISLNSSNSFNIIGSDEIAVRSKASSCVKTEEDNNIEDTAMKSSSRTTKTRIHQDPQKRRPLQIQSQQNQRLKQRRLAPTSMQALKSPRIQISSNQHMAVNRVGIDINNPMYNKFHGGLFTDIDSQVKPDPIQRIFGSPSLVVASRLHQKRHVTHRQPEVGNHGSRSDPPGRISFEPLRPSAPLPQEPLLSSKRQKIQPNEMERGKEGEEHDQQVKFGLSNNPPLFIPLLPNNLINIIRMSTDPSMRTINFDNQSLHDREVIRLSKAMASNHTITSLSLRNCSISDYGVSAGLAIMLTKNNTLAELLLDNNCISTVGALSLSNALKINDTLVTLTLAGNSMLMDAGIVFLINAFEQNGTLRKLDVSNCGNDASARDRAKKMKKILEDRHMNVSRISIGSIANSTGEDPLDETIHSMFSTTNIGSSTTVLTELSRNESDDSDLSSELTVTERDSLNVANHPLNSISSEHLTERSSFDVTNHQLNSISSEPMTERGSLDVTNHPFISTSTTTRSVTSFGSNTTVQLTKIPKRDSDLSELTERASLDVTIHPLTKITSPCIIGTSPPGHALWEMLLGRNESEVQATNYQTEISPLTSSSKSHSGVSPESKRSSEYQGPPTINESVAEDSLDRGMG